MDALIQSVDPITFEILSHRLHQIAKEMGTTLERVGGTVNTTQQHDYMASLYCPNGDVLTAGESTGWHVACAGFAVKRIIERFAHDGGINPDDIFLLNDPYLAAIHQSDVYLIAPIHYRHRLVAWSATFVHVMDIGAMSPGGNSPRATEIFHEGVRIPGIKLVERGALRRDVFDMIIHMTRQPVMVGLDLKCEIAANNVAKSRMQAMVAQYGPELVDAVGAEMIRHSEMVLRNRLAEIPDGCWSESSTIEANDTYRFHLTLRKQRDHLLFDFTGTSKQARQGINLPYHATFGACFEAVLATLAYNLPKNHGLLRPIEVLAPEGTVVHVQYPGPVSMNTTSGGATVKYLARSVLTHMLAGSEKWRDEVIALSVGGRLARHAGINQHGKYYASGFSQSAISGSGARATADGIDSGGRGHASSPNVEWVELNFPLLFLFRRHIADGAGAGKFRGGTGAEAALVLHNAPEGKIKVVAYGVAGLRNSGKGIFGGYPGAPSILTLQEETQVRQLMQQGSLPDRVEDLDGKRNLLPYCDFDLKDDTVFYMRQASGGGYGDPLDRQPASVWADIRAGVVSKESARDIYGVVLHELNDELDLAATQTRRVALRAERLRVIAALAPQGVPLNRETAGLSSENSVEQPVCCTACLRSLGQPGENWRKSCRSALRPPTTAGPLMYDLLEGFLLQQWFCPGCDALLSTELVERSAAANPS